MFIIEINELLGLFGFFFNFAYVRFSDSSFFALHSINILISWKQLQMRVAKKKGKKKTYYSKSSPDHFIPIYSWKVVKAPLWKKNNVLNYLKGLDLSKLKKNLEKWTEALNSETVVQRYCTGCFRSFILQIILLCPLKKLPGILGIKERLNVAWDFVCGTM